MVYIFDVLIETYVKFPSAGQLLLDGTNASFDVKFSNGWVVWCKVYQGVDVEVIVSTRSLSFVKIVLVITVTELHIKIRRILVIGSSFMRVGGSYVVYVAISCSYLKCVRFR